MKNKTQLTFIDLFSGAGGISCGLEMAGHKCLLGVDFNKHAMETFAYNHKHAQTYCGDIGDLSNQKLAELIHSQKINLIVGGPPCQGFSTVGPGNPNDSRNKLFMEFVRIVKSLDPEFIVIENVTGLVAKKNEKTLKAIFGQFTRLGYHLDFQVMEAHKYGVPEKRRRTIIIGSKINQMITFPEQMFDTPSNNRKKPAKSVGDALGNLSYRGKIYNHDLNAAKLKNKVEEKRIAKIPEGRGIRYKKDELEFLPPRLRLGINWDELPEGRFRQTKYQRLDRSGPGPTIMTHRHTYYHPTENRFLTQREAAAIQSFPNNFVFQGPLSAQWRQIGNAVPPLLAKAIGHALSAMYEQSEQKDGLGPKKPTKKSITDIRAKAFHYR